MKKTGIKVKIMLMTTAAMFLLTATIGAIGYFMFDSKVLDSYIKYAEMVVNCANTNFAYNQMGDMIVRREMGEKYDDVRKALNDLKDDSDIKYLYAVFFDDIDDIYSLRYAINGKSTAERNAGIPYSYMNDPCEKEGYEDSLLMLFREAILLNDEEVRYKESDTKQYGRLVTCYQVIRDSKGEAVGIIAADIDANQITADIMTYLRIVVITAIVITVIIVCIFLNQIDSYITSPVDEIARSTDDFVKQMKENVQPEELIFNKPKIRVQDEILVLTEGVESLTSGVKTYMENLRSVTTEKERIGAELSVANHIQADMLPRIFPPFPDRTEFDLYATMTPAKEVGGDFYDFFLVDDDHLGLVMADVSGKGVPAALFMVIAKTLIKNRALLGGTPSEVLSYANEQLCEGNEAELFVTVWFAIIEISTGKGVAANAGHEHPAVRHADGDWELAVYKHSPAVATMEGMSFKEHEFQLQKGDSLFVYTDGVTEATNANDELFGNDRLLHALNRDKSDDPTVFLKNVRADIDEFVGEAPQFDDITMLGLHWNK